MMTAAGGRSGPPPGRGPAGPVSVAVTAGAFDVSHGELDAGGRVDVGVTELGAAVLYRAADGWSAGVAARVNHIRFAFHGPAWTEGLPPWDDVTILTLSTPFTLPAWGGELRAAPSVRWSKEDGASEGSSTVFGGILSLTRPVSDSLSIGFGGAMFSGMDSTWGFPFLAIRWQIDETLRLANPAPLGPASPAGLELAWSPSPAWEVGLGASYRTDHFRLDRDGPAPGGVGEWKAVPAWLRVSRRFGPAQAHLYGGVLMAGRLLLDDADGRKMNRESIAPTPLAGLAVSVRL